MKIKITKGDSYSTADSIYVKVYKSNDKKNPVTGGCIYEGQNSATMYIRNSKNHKTEAGTYYVVVSKLYQYSGFDYSLTWLEK